MELLQFFVFFYYGEVRDFHHPFQQRYYFRMMAFDHYLTSSKNLGFTWYFDFGNALDSLC